jgi:hypothetical protein
MSGFDSPNFKKAHPSIPHREMRTFNVPSPSQEELSGNIPQNLMQPLSQEEELSIHQAKEAARAAREARQNSAGRITTDGKTRIELLTSIGRLTKDITIGGSVFTLRTLKAKETREAAMETFIPGVTQLDATFEGRKQQLARSLVKIDNEDVGLVLGNDTLAYRLEFIEELEENVISKLWDEFQILKTEAKEKYGITTPEDAKVVGEDLKK